MSPGGEGHEIATGVGLYIRMLSVEEICVQRGLKAANSAKNHR